MAGRSSEGYSNIFNFFKSNILQDINTLRRTKENVKDPLFRFFEREINLGARLLTEVRRDLNELLAICRGEQKQNNHTRELIAALVKSKRVPQGWLHYTVPKDVTAHEWMSDLVERVKQLDCLSKSENLRTEPIWLGGMFFPEAYITATRQLIAQTNGWSLEQLTMHVKAVNESDKAGQGGAFTLTGKDCLNHFYESIYFPRFACHWRQLRVAQSNQADRQCRFGSGQTAVCVDPGEEAGPECDAASLSLRQPGQIPLRTRFHSRRF